MADIPAKDPNIDQIFRVRAGKFRRYHGEGLKQLIDLPTIYKNLRDVIYVLIGLIESYFVMRKIKPGLVFSRGSYVSVPVCLGAKLNGISYITHDSDPLPSLTNRIIGRWAKFHFVSVSKEFYPYPSDKTVTTGIPVSRNFVPVSEEVKSKYRQKLNIDQKAKFLFIVGGGLGAQSLNEAVIETLPNLLTEFSDLRVVHIVGRGNKDKVLKDYEDKISPGLRQQVEVIDFTDKVYMYSGTADVVITRAGATNLAEFEVQGVTCIVVPSTALVGGHQLKNAKLLKDNHAAVVIRDTDLENNPHVLAKEVSELLKDGKKRADLAQELSKLGHPYAGSEIASLLISTTEERYGSI